jgi:hypothetical protein
MAMSKRLSNPMTMPATFVSSLPIAWELLSNNVLFERFKQAQSYWHKWEKNEFWPSIRASQISQLEKIFIHHAKYYAIDGDRWPPKAMVRFWWRERTVLVTVGVALRPQPTWR